MVSIATNRLDPEETPKTDGPASGFLKSVCIKRPETESAEPAKIAVSVLGIRDSKKIILLNSDPSF